MMIALVTGANRGVGLAITRALGRRGATVWLGARNEERGRAAEAKLGAEGLKIRHLLLDVADPQSIRAAAARIAAEYDRLDILVNNAGLMVELEKTFPNAVPPSEVPLEKIRLQYATNVLGPIAMIQAMLPLLRKAPAARIVNVSARLGSFAYRTDADRRPEPLNLLGYCSSKAALNMITVSFAREFRDTPIKINAVSPGTIATDLSGPRKEELAGKPGMGEPEDGANVIMRYIDLPTDGPSGRFFGPDGEYPW